MPTIASFKMEVTQRFRWPEGVVPIPTLGTSSNSGQNPTLVVRRIEIANG